MEAQSELLTASEFAAMCRVTISAVRRWAAQGIGPRPLRPTGSRVVRYRRSEIEAWLSGQSIEDPEAAACRDH